MKTKLPVLFILIGTHKYSVSFEGLTALCTFFYSKKGGYILTFCLSSVWIIEKSNKISIEIRLNGLGILYIYITMFLYIVLKFEGFISVMQYFATNTSWHRNCCTYLIKTPVISNFLIRSSCLQHVLIYFSSNSSIIQIGFSLLWS